MFNVSFCILLGWIKFVSTSMFDTLVHFFNIIALYTQCLMIQSHKFTSQEDKIDKKKIETIVLINLTALRYGQG